MFIISCSGEDLKQLQESQKELDKARNILSEKEGSQEIYDSIQEGMSMEEVKEIAGEPLDVQQLESSGVKTEIWYYEGKLQVIFMDGFVNSKAKW